MNMPREADVAWIRQQLLRARWYAELPQELQDALIDNGVVRQFDKGEYLLEQGAVPDGLYAVLEGQVAFLNLLPDDRDFLLNLVGPSYWFADPSVLLGTPMPHRVVARSKVLTLIVPTAAVNRIRGRNSLWATHFTRMHASRFLHAINALAEAAAMPRTVFLRKRLADLAQLLDPPAASDTSEIIEIAVSQEELALMVGVSRQSLNGYLSDLENQGLLEVGFRAIRIRRSALALLTPAA